jgi:hypothetical protein
MTRPSHKAQRARGPACGRTVPAPPGPPCSRLRTAVDVVPRGLTGLCQGGPLPAIVAALGVAARTVAPWPARGGHPCWPGPRPLVQQGQGDRGPVPADDLGITLVGQRVWRALALAVPSRRWLAGVLSPPRARARLTLRGQRGRAWARRLALRVGVEGWASAVPACRRVCRSPVRSGRPGRPRLGGAPGLLRGPVLKRYAQRRVGEVGHRGGRGTTAASAAALPATGAGPVLTPASRERRNAPLGSALAPLVRRGRALAPPAAVRTAGLYRVGGADQGCWDPRSLRPRAPAAAPQPWQARTPAMAAGWTEHGWTMPERRSSQGPLPAGVPPQRRGRPPKQTSPPEMAEAV